MNCLQRIGTNFHEGKGFFYSCQLVVNRGRILFRLGQSFLVLLLFLALLLFLN